MILLMGFPIRVECNLMLKAEKCTQLRDSYFCTATSSKSVKGSSQSDPLSRIPDVGHQNFRFLMALAPVSSVFYQIFVHIGSLTDHHPVASPPAAVKLARNL